MFFSCNFDMDSVVVGVIMTFITWVILIYIWTLYTYVRELEDNFKNCELSNDVKYVHEFVKLYSLILVLIICMVLVTLLSTILSFFQLPKYYFLDMKMKKQLYNNSNFNKSNKLKKRLNNMNNNLFNNKSNSKSNSKSNKSKKSGKSGKSKK
jgi:H+/gluconate symporter-like permease